MTDADDKTLAARRLSAALGRKVEPDEIRAVYDGDHVRLWDGTSYALFAGNLAYWAGTGKWFKNGKPYEPKVGDEIKDLSSP